MHTVHTTHAHSTHVAHAHSTHVAHAHSTHVAHAHSTHVAHAIIQEFLSSEGVEYIKVVLQNGRMVGAVLVGDTELEVGTKGMCVVDVMWSN